MKRKGNSGVPGAVTKNMGDHARPEFVSVKGERHRRTAAFTKQNTCGTKSRARLLSFMHIVRAGVVAAAFGLD
jgi:hypothetical protein